MTTAATKTTQSNRQSKQKTLHEKLHELELEKQKLIHNRKSEIVKLIEKLGILSLDDELLLGALIMVKEAHDNNDKEKLEEFRKKAQSGFRKSRKSTKTESTNVEATN